MIIKTADFLTAAAYPGPVPEFNYPEVAFAGRSNVGKSSLLNIMVNRKHLARTSRTPGRTRQINFFNINGNLLFVREGALMAQPFDPQKLEFTGDAVPVAEGVLVVSGASLATFSASHNGILSYITGKADVQAELEWRDRAGKVIGTLGDPTSYRSLVVSPDDQMAAVLVTDMTIGTDDIWITRRTTKNDPWGPPINLGAVVNSSASDDHPFLTADGLALFFSEDRGQPLHPLRPGGFGDVDMWATTRSSTSEPWGTPVNLGPVVNSTSLDGGPVVSPDGSTLYFSSERPGGFGGAWGDIYQAPIIPIVDFDGDGIVDSADMCIMVDHWGTNDPLCDIGPMPWGDGVVDVQDLIVLAEHLFEEFPPVESQK